MKTPFLIFVLTLSFIPIFAQNEKGNIQAFVMASPFPSELLNENDFGVLGLIGIEYFINSKIGLSSNFFITNNTLITNNSNYPIRSYGFLPTVQYYFFEKQKWNTFGMVGYGFGLEQQPEGFVENSSLTVVSAGVGGSYWLSNHIGLKILLPYMHARNQTFNKTSLAGVGAFIGFNYKF